MARFILTKDDFLAASWHIQRKYRLLLYGWAMVVGGLVVLYLSRGVLGLAGSIAVGLFAAVFGVSLRLYLNRRKAMRIFDDHLASDPEISVGVTDDGIGIERKNGSVSIKWEQLKFWSENDRFLLLYQGRDFAQILRKDALSEEEDALIRKHVGRLKRI